MGVENSKNNNISKSRSDTSKGIFAIIIGKIDSIFEGKPINNNQIVTPDYSDISEEIVQYGDIPAFRKPKIKFTNNGKQKKEEDYKLYKLSDIL